MAELDAEKELRDNRFSYLLQPIRDLAANWDINIAGELEEYLEELENLTFTIEGCGPALNFAEAALLIQGTTCVFSKKVEYLHNLVYQALETIFNKKQKERQAAANKSKVSRQADAADELDDAEAFYCLGDQLELAAHADIDLGEEDETAPPELLRPPTALLALEDAACGQGGQQTGTRGEVGSYRLAQCSVHISGALLLESRDGQLYDADLRPLRGSRGTAATAGLSTAHDGGMLGSAMAGLAGLTGSYEGTLTGSQTGCAAAAVDGYDDEANAACDAYDDAGHDGYGGDDDDAFMQQHSGEAAAAGTASDADMADVQQEEPGGAAAADGEQDDGPPDWLSQPADDDAVGGHEQHQGGENGAAAANVEEAAGARVRQQRGRRRAADADDAAPAGYYDPYLPLDPAAPGNLPIKPLQVRKPRQRTNTSAMQQLDTNGSTSTACLNASHHPHLAWPEFGYLLDKLAAAAAAARNSSKRRGEQQQQQHGLLAVGPQVAAVMDWQDAAAAEQREQEVMMEDDNQAAAGDFGGDGYEDDYAPDTTAADLLGDVSMLEAAGQEGLAGGLRPWATTASADGMPNWMGGQQEGARDASYEELCRSHIESLIAAAAAQQTASELAVRVGTWRNRIDTILAAEEDRSAFDIHDYGTKILDRLIAVKDEKPAVDKAANELQQQPPETQQNDAAGDDIVDFKQVARAADSYEVCRLFAAMLQLVNNRNIHLVKEYEAEDEGSCEGSACSNLRLQLLTVARVHEAMAEGLAGGEQGLQLTDGHMDVPPPRSKPAPKKTKGSKTAAQCGEGAAAGKGSKAGKGGSKGTAARKGGKKKAADSSSDDEGVVSELSDSDNELGTASAAAAGKGRAAAGKTSKAAATDASADDGAGTSDEFDADAENQVLQPAAAAQGKGSKPPAKKAKRLGVAA